MWNIYSSQRRRCYRTPNRAGLMGTEKNAEQSENVDLDAAGLIAALSYMIDMFPEGCHFHSWRVALVGERLASMVAPELKRDIFISGLLHDVGAVGAYKHISEYRTLHDQLENPYIRNHPRYGAALLDWLPGTTRISSYVRSHHEWWDGRGYPENRVGSDINIGAQIIRLADATDIANCFFSSASLASGLQSMSVLTESAWSEDIWMAFAESVEDSGFYDTLMDESSLTGAIASKLDEVGLPEELNDETGVERFLHLIAVLVDTKDPSTSGHSLRTARYAKAIAQSMGLSKQDVQLTYRAGLVHDCGRLGVPTLLLARSGRLNDEEMALVRRHAEMTIRAFSCIPNAIGMAEFGRIAGHDHERFDGNGYPDKLTGDKTPLISKILSATDAFDAMTSPSSFRQQLSSRFAVIRLQQGAGSQFDPDIVDAIVAAIKAGKLTELSKAA